MYEESGAFETVIMSFRCLNLITMFVFASVAFSLGIRKAWMQLAQIKFLALNKILKS